MTVSRLLELLEYFAENPDEYNELIDYSLNTCLEQ